MGRPLIGRSVVRSPALGECRSVLGQDRPTEIPNCSHDRSAVGA